MVITTKFFYEPGRVKRALWRDHDASAFFVSHRHSDNILFRGSFVFRIAFQCLNNADAFAEQLIDFAVKATSITHNINARIALSPIPAPDPCSAHMMYLGRSVGGDKSHIEAGFRPEEWYPYYYFQGAEWFNLLSPIVGSRLSRPFLDTQMCNQVVLEKRPNGVILVRSGKVSSKQTLSTFVTLEKFYTPYYSPEKAESYSAT